MEIIQAKDRERLRALANQKIEIADSTCNKEVLEKWKAQEQGRREYPTVRFLFTNFPQEVITPQLMCEGKAARQMESTLLTSFCGQTCFGDDTPVSKTYDIYWKTHVSPFGIQPQLTHAEEENSKGFHIDPVISDLEEDFEKLQGGYFSVDREATKQEKDLAEDIFGDILPVKMNMESLTGAITNPLVHLMGMENYYISMYDCPDILHKVMDMATTVYEDYYNFLENEKLLLPTTGTSPLAQESFCFTNELPSENATSTTQCWGFLESQESTAVSPETFGEFVFPYQDRLVKRFGLLSYGCCERVDAIFPDYISKWQNLRKLSVSPFNNEEQVGEYLRGSHIVYYSKPRAEHVTKPGQLDEEYIANYFKGVAKAASGCLFEVAQREVGTIFGDINRGRQYVKIAKEAIEKYWQP